MKPIQPSMIEVCELTITHKNSQSDKRAYPHNENNTKEPLLTKSNLFSKLHKNPF
ncbi:MAG: hypothetical protein WA080_04385 [Sulfuricurvum sp.]